MPIYEYECEKCNTTFEAMQSVSAKPLKNCTASDCKGKVHRLVSASGFILKGSGWYTSDYPSEARKKGWESEGQNTTANKSKSTEGDTPSEKTPAPASQTPTPTEKTTTKPAPKKPTQKNPYSGGKKSRAKTAT
jgi:putative FmdB family regulatory protein